MITFGRAPRYHAWILRCWEVNGGAPPRPTPWHFSLEDPHTRERQGFASMESLVAFLLDELADTRDGPEGCGGASNGADPVAAG